MPDIYLKMVKKGCNFTRTWYDIRKIFEFLDNN